MAIKTFTSIAQFQQLIKPMVEKMLDKIAQHVKDEVDKAIEEYYNYQPIRYLRTDQLRNCCKISDIKSGTNEISIEVYLDIDSLHYPNKGADPYKTVMSADSGLHGGWDVNDLSKSQIPWDDIKDGDADYGEVRIWTDPIEDMINNGKIREWFVKYAKQYGLTIV